MADPVDIVTRYFAVVADLGSSEEELAALLHPDVAITEHPNLVTPSGATRNRDETLAGFAAGKALLSAQSFEILSTVAEGERVAVKGAWSGTVAIDAGPFTKGKVLVAQIAAHLTLSDGLIREHETFDCYEPF